MESTKEEIVKEDLVTTNPNSLNVMCSICYDFYKNTDQIFSTTCGHVFHKKCLLLAFIHSKTCPECRRPSGKNSIHPIFLNFSERTEMDSEINVSGAYDTYSNMPIWTPLYELEWDRSQQGPRSPPEPDEAIQAGTDNEGNPSYVARVYFEDDLLPAAYVPSKGVAYASHGCNGYTFSENIELLNNFPHKWVAGSNGNVPEGAIMGGYSELGENLYVARGQYNGKILLGKVHPSHRVMYMPYDGIEVHTDEYEVLVQEKVTAQPSRGGGETSNES